MAGIWISCNNVKSMLPSSVTSLPTMSVRDSDVPGQVHAARLAPEMLAELGWRWRHGPEVVVKVQNRSMQAR